MDPLETSPAPDLVALNLPHKPVVPGRELPLWQDGGAEGDALHARVAELLPSRLAPGGQVLLFLHSLVHPRLFARHAATFTIELVAWRRRWFAPGEYDAHLESFRARTTAGTSLLFEDGDRQFLFAGAFRLRFLS